MYKFLKKGKNFYFIEIILAVFNNFSFKTVVDPISAINLIT